MIRQAGPQDVRFLRDMLKHAYHWRLNEDPDLPVARYVNNWGRPGDAGLVAPSRRGGGLGGELMQALLVRAKQQGHTSISLSAEKGMTRLYERFGFRPVEEKDGTVTMTADLG